MSVAMCDSACDSLFSQCQSGLSGAKSTGRSMAKEFIFDHSYWSVSSSDDHYADQELVSHLT